MAPEKDPVTFPEAVFNQLVDRNFKSALSPEEFPEGWSKQKIDPMNLLSRYRHLNIRKGYTLRGLQYRSGHNGNGFVFAMREDAPFPDPPEFDFTGQRLFDPPYPEGADPKFMKVILGDGTPQAYLQASIFEREACSIGAMWHGRSWSLGGIAFSDPTLDRDGLDDHWTWKKAKPQAWEPQYLYVDGQHQITFHVSSSIDERTVSRYIDKFHKNSMAFSSERELLAHGGAGFLF